MKIEKDTNQEGDVVLVHQKDKPALYARIEAIGPDVKKDWFQVTLLLLTLPAQVVTWILREEYINGAPFTMGGKPMRLEKVKRIGVQEEPKQEVIPDVKKGRHKPARVIPFKKGKR
jgi:hypothetical protein